MMLPETTIARKYAQAFFNVNRDSLNAVRIHTIAHYIVFLKQHQDALRFLHIIHVDNILKVDALTKIAASYDLDTFLRPLIILLAEQKRLFLLPDILNIVSTLHAESQNIVSFEASSVIALDEPIRNIIHTFLTQQTKGRINITYTIDKKLIAGIALKSKNYRWEHSVRKQLLNLKNSPFM